MSTCALYRIKRNAENALRSNPLARWSLLTPLLLASLIPSFSFLLSLSMILILSVTGNFFLASRLKCQSTPRRVLAGREGRINNLADAGVEEYPIQ